MTVGNNNDISDKVIKILQDELEKEIKEMEDKGVTNG